MSAYEFEALPEFETEFEYEGEFEGEFEGEYESEEFFRVLAGLAQRAAQSPTLRRVAAGATRAALQGFSQEAEWEGEAEWEMETEWEGELNPIRRVYPDALMEHLGHAATEAESEAEAEAFIGALVPLAARLLPRVAPTIMRVAPQLIRGLSGVTRTLRRSPRTRPLVRTLPTVVRRTAADLARQTARGRPVTGRTAVRALARQTQRVLGSPQQSVRAFQRSRTLDRRYHQCVPSTVRLRVGDRC